MKKGLKLFSLIIAVCLLIVGGYVVYVFFSYDRIEDRQPLAVTGDAVAAPLRGGETYTVITQNAGFGAYTADFTFFMDGGKSSRADSKESVERCIDGIITNVGANDPDFILLQELDTDATRSYHVDETARVAAAFPGYDWVFALNFHSAYLMYPPWEPHGASVSGIMTLSRFPIKEAIRRQLPVSETLSRFIDLDRCYSVARVPVDDGKELVLYNVHFSAYGGSDSVRAGQMEMVFEDMKREYAQGNYCLCGGDFNHDFTGNSTQIFNDVGAADFGWAQPFPEKLLPEGIHRCLDYDNATPVPTCRNCDVPYDEKTFVLIVDGFLASDNIEVEQVENIDKKFEFSDHNPVRLQFSLQTEER